MKKGYGKAKGAGFEREVLKLLSLWISDNKRTDIFWRSAMSGGRATIQNRKGIENKSQLGDVSCIDILGQPLIDKYIIECKNYSNIHLESLLYGAPFKGSIREFWMVLTTQCLNAGKLPILIFKENRKEIMMGISKPTKKLLQYYNNLKIIMEIIDVYDLSPNLYILPLTNFLKEVDPVQFTSSSE